VNISLEQAIHIHARALKSRAGERAPALAGDRAKLLKATGDEEGFRVWSRVESVARQLIGAEKPTEPDGV